MFLVDRLPAGKSRTNARIDGLIGEEPANQHAGWRIISRHAHLWCNLFLVDVRSVLRVGERKSCGHEPDAHERDYLR
jgi:hypothetical protein